MVAGMSIFRVSFGAPSIPVSNFIKKYKATPTPTNNNSNNTKKAKKGYEEF